MIIILYMIGPAVSGVLHADMLSMRIWLPEFSPSTAFVNTVYNKAIQIFISQDLPSLQRFVAATVTSAQCV